MEYSNGVVQYCWEDIFLLTVAFFLIIIGIIMFHKNHKNY